MQTVDIDVYIGIMTFLGHMSDALIADMSTLLAHRYFIITVLIVLSAISVVDLIIDHNEGASIAHMLQEGAVFGLCVLAAARLMWELRSQKLKNLGLRKDLDDAHREVEQASQSVKEGRLAFAKTIGQQFEGWGFSKSEREVALLLLKGFSLSEIASLRDTKEKTVRQQASSLYKKAGVSGRHAFSAWFIEDAL